MKQAEGHSLYRVERLPFTIGHEWEVVMERPCEKEYAIERCEELMKQEPQYWYRVVKATVVWESHY